MKPELKKLLILNAPYLLFVYLFDKIGQAVRLAPGADLSGKVLSLADGFSAAFATPLPSLAPMDFLIGIARGLSLSGLWCTSKARTRRNIAKVSNTVLPVGEMPKIYVPTPTRYFKITCCSHRRNGLP